MLNYLKNIFNLFKGLSLREKIFTILFSLFLSPLLLAILVTDAHYKEDISDFEIVFFLFANSFILWLLILA